MALQQKWEEEASTEQLEAAQHVINLEAATLTCPACQTTFENPGLGAPCECPNCELRLA